MARKMRGAMISVNSKRLKDAGVGLRNLSTSLRSSEEVVVSASGNFFQKMQARAGESLRETKVYIRTLATTPTGEKRGYPNQGRYESGEMYRTFIGTRGSGTTKSPSGKKVRFYFQMGWLERMPNYTLFQEFGTAKGVQAMNALDRARQELDWNIREELGGSIKALQADVRGALLASLKGNTFTKASTIQSSVWRDVLSTSMNDEYGD